MEPDVLRLSIEIPTWVLWVVVAYLAIKLPMDIYLIRLKWRELKREMHGEVS